MTARLTSAALASVAMSALAACGQAHIAGPETASVEPEIVPAASGTPEIIETPAEQSLVYEWDTEFSAFLSPPIEVRRMARDDCVDAGYEVAVVETLALEGSVARATYICRGDFE